MLRKLVARTFWSYNSGISGTNLSSRGCEKLKSIDSLNKRRVGAFR